VSTCTKPIGCPALFWRRMQALLSNNLALARAYVSSCYLTPGDALRADISKVQGPLVLRKLLMEVLHLSVSESSHAVRSREGRDRKVPRGAKVRGEPSSSAMSE
jgi:hypothetical protein